MPDRLCCPECFGDTGLRHEIIPSLSKEQGECGYCGTNAVPLVKPEDLRQWFELVAGAYVEDSHGCPLVELLRRDWRLFSHPCMDDAHAKELLADVLDDGEFVRRPFAPSSLIHSESLKKWDDLRDEMMHKNRWFLDEPMDLDRLQDLLDFLIAPEADLGNTWFRARLMTDDKAFPLAEMGAPPPKSAGHGRANPAGIPYLYLGSTQGTAVAEIRPHTGELACVAEFTVPVAIRAVDLRDPRAQVSPFLLSDPSAISQLRADLPLLERLGGELTRPVIPRGVAYEYTPSQYLCEFIKTRGFDGVVYRSSVSDGINLALFEPSLARAVNIDTLKVDRVTVETVPHTLP